MQMPVRLRPAWSMGQVSGQRGYRVRPFFKRIFFAKSVFWLFQAETTCVRWWKNHSSFSAFFCYLLWREFLYIPRLANKLDCMWSSNLDALDLSANSSIIPIITSVFLLPYSISLSSRPRVYCSWPASCLGNFFKLYSLIKISIHMQVN